MYQRDVCYILGEITKIQEKKETVIYYNLAALIITKNIYKYIITLVIFVFLYLFL